MGAVEVGTHARETAQPLRFTRLLVPTDFSDCADRAFACALDVARRYGAEVQLLHVMNPVEGDTYSPLKYTPEANVLKEAPEHVIYKYLEKCIAAHDTTGLSVVPARFRGVATVPTVLNYAAKEEVDLIVVGIHERHGVQSLMHRHIAEKVVRGAACDVLVVPEEENSLPGTLARILVPVDFSGFSGAVLRIAAALAVDYDAQIDLLHLIEPATRLSVFVSRTASETPTTEADAHAALEVLAAMEVPGDVPVKIHVEKGPAASRLLAEARRLGSDLVVMASHGPSAPRRRLLGSVTERVVRGAACPVFVARPARS